MVLGITNFISAHAGASFSGHQGMMDGEFGYVFMLILMILVIVVLILLIVWLIKKIQQK